METVTTRTSRPQTNGGHSNGGHSNRSRPLTRGADLERDTFAEDLLKTLTEGGDILAGLRPPSTEAAPDTQILEMLVGNQGGVDEKKLVGEVSSLKRLYEMGEQTLSKYRPGALGAALHPVTPSASTAHHGGKTVAAAAALLNFSGHRFQVPKEKLDVSFEQLPELADMTAAENEKLAKIWRQKELHRLARAVHTASSSRTTDEMYRMQELLQLIAANFQRGIAEVETLIERAKNKEFLGVVRDEEDTTVQVDLILDKNGLLPGDKSRAQQQQQQQAQQTTTTSNAGENAAAAAANVSSFVTGMNKKNTLRSRKSFRQIREGLFRKIESYRTNQVEMELFQRRIELYYDELAHQGSDEIIRSNKKAVKGFAPEVRKVTFAKEVQEKNEHRQEVLEKKAAMRQEYHDKLVKRIEWRDTHAVMAKQAQQEKEEKDLLRATQQRWLTLTIIGSRLYTLQKALKENHVTRGIYIRQNHCALIIQHAWRKYYERKQNSIRLAATQQIVRFVVKHLPAHRKRMRHKAADLLGEYFQEFTGVSKLMKVIKKYRFNVLTAQNSVRHHLVLRHAQVNLIKMKWDKVQTVWAKKKFGNQQQLGGAGEAAAEATSLRKQPSNANLMGSKNKSRSDLTARKSTNDLSVRKSNQELSAKPKQRKSKKKDNTSFQIPDDIRSRIILEDLLQRKKAYVPQFWEHRELLAAWNTKLRHRLEMTQSLRSSANASPSANMRKPTDATGQQRAASPKLGSAHSNAPRIGSSAGRAKIYMDVDMNARTLAKDVIVPNLAINPKIGYPVIKNFKVLPSDEEMLRLIERAYTEYVDITSKQTFGGADLLAAPPTADDNAGSVTDIQVSIPQLQ